MDVLDVDTLYDFGRYEAEEVLVCLVRDGADTGEGGTIDEARERCRASLRYLDPATRRFLNPQIYPVALEPGLSALRSRLAREERELAGNPVA